MRTFVAACCVLALKRTCVTDVIAVLYTDQTAMIVKSYRSWCLYKQHFNYYRAV